MMDAISEAANLFFAETPGRGRTLNLKMGSLGRGRLVTADQIARELIHAEGEVRSGRARKVEAID